MRGPAGRCGAPQFRPGGRKNDLTHYNWPAGRNCGVFWQNCGGPAGENQLKLNHGCKNTWGVTIYPVGHLSRKTRRSNPTQLRQLHTTCYQISHMFISLRERMSDVPAVIECTWGQFCEYVQGHAHGRSHVHYSDKTQTPSFLPAKTNGSFQEPDIDPAGLELLCLDFDRIDMNRINEFCDYVELASFRGEWLIHTTWNHGITEHGRMRAIFPLDKPVPKYAWAAMWAEAAEAFVGPGFVVDPVCQNFARCYFLPVVNPQAPEWARAPWVSFKA